MARDRSRQVFQTAQQLMPGGVNSPARAFGAVGGEPVVFNRGEGAFLHDVDGNQYLDYVGSWGPLILGHADERVVAAINKAAAKGCSFGAPTEAVEAYVNWATREGRPLDRELIRQGVHVELPETEAQRESARVVSSRLRHLAVAGSQSG